MVRQKNKNPNDRLPMRTSQDRPDEKFGSWISPDSRGFQIMSNMGYQWGQPLGFHSRGITNPIETPLGRPGPDWEKNMKDLINLVSIFQVFSFIYSTS